jgi:hypothetical protein
MYSCDDLPGYYISMMLNLGEEYCISALQQSRPHETLSYQIECIGSIVGIHDLSIGACIEFCSYSLLGSIIEE